MDLKNKKIWITGASSGIGMKIAEAAAGAGALPFMTARSAESLEQAAAQISGAVWMKLDVTEQAQVNEAAKRMTAELGGIDVLVNNAGYGKFASVMDARMEDIHGMMEVNYFGLVRCTKAVLPHMLQKRQGHIVNIASLAGMIGTAQSAGYSASKHAVLGFTNSLRQELVGSGVHISAVNPGPVNTAFFDQADPSGQYVDKVKRYMLEPEMVAQAVLKAVQRNVRQQNMPWSASLGAKLWQLFPGISDKLVTALFRKS